MKATLTKSRKKYAKNTLPRGADGREADHNHSRDGAAVSRVGGE